MTSYVTWDVAGDARQARDIFVHIETVLHWWCFTLASCRIVKVDLLAVCSTDLRYVMNDAVAALVALVIM